MRPIAKAVCITACFGFGMLAGPATAQRQQAKSTVHEITPFVGMYAPDRFETSVVFGVKYFYRINQDYTAGAVLGFANARQDFLRQSSNFVPVGGSEQVIFHGARISRSLLQRTRVQPYLIGQLGLTRLHDENNLTIALGLGTRVITRGAMSLRYEIVSHIFKSGSAAAEWTNTNLEIAFGLGFFF